MHKSSEIPCGALELNSFAAFTVLSGILTKSMAKVQDRQRVDMGTDLFVANWTKHLLALDQ